MDELHSISVFDKKKTIIIDVRQSDKKTEINKIFDNINFLEIKDIQLIIVGYLFKQTDSLTKKVINCENAISFTCYEEDEYNIKDNLKKELLKINLKLSDSQIYELSRKFSTDTKIIQNTFEKIRLQKSNSNISFDQLMKLIDDNNDKTINEMINKLMAGNYYESISLLTNFEQVNKSSITLLYFIKNKFKLLKKCINMKKNGLTKKEIVNDKSLNIFYKEHLLFFKMLDLWTLSNIDKCLFYLFKVELNCKSKKEYEYIFLNQLFLYVYFQIKA